MKSKFMAFLKDEGGQTSTEYILLVAVVALIVFRFKKIAVQELEGITKTIFSGAGNKITEEFDF